MSDGRRYSVTVSDRLLRELHRPDPPIDLWDWLDGLLEGDETLVQYQVECTFEHVVVTDDPTVASAVTAFVSGGWDEVRKLHDMLQAA